jgi:hypothetical protein
MPGSLPHRFGHGQSDNAAACGEAAPVHRTQHLRVAERIESEPDRDAPGHDRVLSSRGFGDGTFPKDRLEPCREADHLQLTFSTRLT